MCYLCVLWSRDCKLPYVYLTCSVRLTCRYPRGLCGYHTGMGTSVAGTVRSRVVCRAGLTIPVRSVVQGITGSGEARECTLGLYLPSHTRVCDI